MNKFHYQKELLIILENQWEQYHIQILFLKDITNYLKIANKLIPISAIKDYKNSFNEVITKLKDKANCINNKIQNELNTMNDF